MLSRRDLLRRASFAGLTIPLLTSAEVINSPAPPPGAASWDDIRKEFLLDKGTVFFNPGTVGVMPKVVVERMTAHLEHMARNVAQWAYKDDNAEQYISGYNNLLPLRTKVAQLLNADAADLAMTDNVTNGMSYLANGLELKSGDEVISTNQEHGGGRSPWLLREKRSGIVYREVTLGKPIKNAQEAYDAIVKSFTDKTRVLMVSHMITGSGAILPVKEICAEARRRGIITILDGAQTIGQIKVDIKDIGCDAYLGCFHKWIGAPCGTGFMYVQKDLMPQVWTTVASGRWDNHTDEGFRFTQRGTGSFSILMGLDAALDFHFETGPERVYDRIKFLGKRLRDGLRENPKVKIFSPQEESMCAGITVYTIEGWSGAAIQDEYWNRAKMRPRSQGKEFGVRHCTHIFNSEKEIDKAIALVKQFSTESPRFY